MALTLRDKKCVLMTMKTDDGYTMIGCGASECPKKNGKGDVNQECFL